METQGKSELFTEYGHTPLGRDVEAQLRVKMKDWSNEDLFSETQKNSLNAYGIAARQLLDARHEAKATERYKSTTTLTIILWVLGFVVATWLGWMALP